MAITRPKAHQIDFDLTNITDPLVRINSGQTTANDKDIGLVLERGSDTNVALIWDESADEFALINTSEDGTTSGNVTISSYASIRAGTFYGDGSGLTGVTSYTDSDVATYLSSNGYDTATNIVASITDSAPGTLDTLNELAAALGDDANFSTTVTTSIGEKLAKASNLSDLTNTATARTNLGLGTAATTASTDYATSAQGTTADAALARSGGTITGDVTLSGASILVADNEAVRFGAGQDLVIFHDGVGGGSYINEAGSGDLYIQGANIQLRKYGSSEVMADFNVDGSVQLYYNNLLKLQTTTTGVKISGDATTDAELMLHPGTNTDPVISFQGQSGETTSEGAQIWYDNSVGDLHIVSSYDHVNGGIRFHTRQPGHLQEGNERLTIEADGNVGIGTNNPSYKLEVNGTIHGSGNITTGGLFSGTATSARYADLAERYTADDNYEPGTVLIIGGDAEVTACEKYRDSRLAGVVSTNPAYLMNTNLEGENVVELALVGRVPCKVTGLINKGDLLTTSSTKGVATVYNSSDYIPGTIIGKALESYSDSSVGVIEILVGKV